eukprot:TRINITY_DN2839_c0_g1_i2.p1 TRINITY_DN2839_c0_g1~~TRINITY_DN2839_c0_g1_i2.p1  ORF type:complete len:319 (-),score=61.65 TRINITY_DN2839_c0_g1_i2:53-1009(-)
MEVNTPLASYGLKACSRKLVSIPPNEEEDDAHSFLVGTLNYGQPNEIQRLTYSERSESIECEAVYEHEHEIWDMALNPTDTKQIFTVYNVPGAGKRCSLWEMPDLDGTHGALNRIQDIELDDVNSVVWSPKDLGLNQVAFCTKSNIHVADVGRYEECKASSLNEEEQIQKILWDPHHERNIGYCAGKDICSLDLRSGRTELRVENAHEDTILDIHFNPNRPSYLVSCGEDSTMAFWDLRNCAEPVRVVNAHTHWTSTVRYNPFHDQLLLTGGTDSTVKLWRQPSVSSAVLLQQASIDTFNGSDDEDGMISSDDDLGMG